VVKAPFIDPKGDRLMDNRAHPPPLNAMACSVSIDRAADRLLRYFDQAGRFAATVGEAVGRALPEAAAARLPNRQRSEVRNVILRGAVHRDSALSSDRQRSTNSSANGGHDDGCMVNRRRHLRSASAGRKVGSLCCAGWPATAMPGLVKPAAPIGGTAGLTRAFKQGILLLVNACMRII